MQRATDAEPYAVRKARASSTEGVVSRKKTGPSPQKPQTGFAFPSMAKPSVADVPAAAAPIAADSIDDVPERPKLRLVHRGPDEDVTVEPDATYEGMFWIDCVRHDGTTRGMVRVTRKQLEMLVKRGAAALEVGK